jgi:hypothetical protein
MCVYAVTHAYCHDTVGFIIVTALCVYPSQQARSDVHQWTVRISELVQKVVACLLWSCDDVVVPVVWVWLDPTARCCGAAAAHACLWCWLGLICLLHNCCDYAYL